MNAESGFLRLDAATGRLSALNESDGGVIQMSLSNFQSAQQAQFGQLLAESPIRTDGSPVSVSELAAEAADRAWNVPGVILDHARAQVGANQNSPWAQILNPAAGRPGVRQDAYEGLNGFALPLQTSFVSPRLLRQPLARLTSFDVLTNRSDVPAWATEFIVQREEMAARAAFSEGSDGDIPIASSARKPQSWPVYTIVSSYQVNWIEMNILNYAGINKSVSDQRASHRGVQYLMNRTNWFGNSDLGIPGLLNYPLLSRQTTTTAFSASGSADTMLQLLNYYATWAFSNSLGYFKPTTLRVSPAIFAVISSKNFSSYQEGGQTVLAQFLKNQRLMNPGFTVEMSPELSASADLVAVGAPSGYHAMAFIAQNEDSAGFVNPMGIIELAPQIVGFTTKHIVLTRYGGVSAPDAGANLIVFAPIA